jgi:hypothetical protein
MKTEYLNSPDMRKLYLRNTFEHELAIATGRNAFDNLKASLAHAKALLESRRFDSVVYVNIPFSARRFTDTRREVFPKSENNPAFEVLHMQEGRLGPSFSYVRQQATRAKGKVAVIINSWEMSSSCYRYKEQLLFGIHSLVCADEITVIVYSQAKKGSVEPGVIHRAGLGRLPLFATGVIELQEEKQEAEEEKQVFVEDILPPKIIPAPAESVQLHGNKINELRYADSVKKKELEYA